MVTHSRRDFLKGIFYLKGWGYVSTVELINCYNGRPAPVQVKKGRFSKAGRLKKVRKSEKKAKTFVAFFRACITFYKLPSLCLNEEKTNRLKPPAGRQLLWFWRNFKLKKTANRALSLKIRSYLHPGCGQSTKQRTA